MNITANLRLGNMPAASDMDYFLALNFGPVTPDGQKAMHMSPPCISTGVLKDGKSSLWLHIWLAYENRESGRPKLRGGGFWSCMVFYVTEKYNLTELKYMKGNIQPYPRLPIRRQPLMTWGEREEIKKMWAILEK